MNSGLDLRSLAGAVLRSCPPLSAESRRFIQAAHGQLAEGSPVSLEAIARRADIAAEAAAAVVVRMPGLARFNRAGDVVGFLGLSLDPTPHVFEVNDLVLYTWCAWDSLFISRLLGTPARVISRCPVTGDSIQLGVTPDAVHDVAPPETVVSFLIACDPRQANGVVGACCEHIHFLSSARAGEEWLLAHRVGAVLSLGDAFELGRLFVDEVLRGGLASPHIDTQLAAATA